MSDKVAETIRLRVRIMEYEARAAVSDKPAMTGRQFVREVGADPRKWALYLLDRLGDDDLPPSLDEKVDFIADIIRDAMEAAIKHARLTAPPLFPEEEPDG